MLYFVFIGYNHINKFTDKPGRGYLNNCTEVSILTYRLLLIFIIILSYLFFSNVFLRGGGRSFFNSLEKTLLGLGISVLLYLVLGFVLEGPLASSRYVVSISDGILIGWIISLFRHMSETS